MLICYIINNLYIYFKTFLDPSAFTKYIILRPTVWNLWTQLLFVTAPSILKKKYNTVFFCTFFLCAAYLSNVNAGSTPLALTTCRRHTFHVSSYIIVVCVARSMTFLDIVFLYSVYNRPSAEVVLLYENQFLEVFVCWILIYLNGI